MSQFIFKKNFINFFFEFFNLSIHSLNLVGRGTTILAIKIQDSIVQKIHFFVFYYKFAFLKIQKYFESCNLKK